MNVPTVLLLGKSERRSTERLDQDSLSRYTVLEYGVYSIRSVPFVKLKKNYIEEYKGLNSYVSSH